MSTVKAGVCVHLKSGDNLLTHLWVVLTDPQGDPPRVVLVNLTKHKPQSDETVVLNAGDHPFIKQKTVVNYARATIQDAAALERAMKADLTMRHKIDCTGELLERLREGVFNSRFTRPIVQKFCEHLKKQQATRTTSR
jgi:queuine/archaeosine tRNA-ribosyltransferase